MTKLIQPKMTDEEIQAARNYCRKAAALYLQDLAEMIENGAVDGFEIAWSHTALKTTPVGSVLFDAEYLSTRKPEPIAVVVVPKPEQEATAQTLASESAPISVEDISEEMSDLKPCEHPDCPNCQNKS